MVWLHAWIALKFDLSGWIFIQFAIIKKIECKSFELQSFEGLCQQRSQGKKLFYLFYNRKVVAKFNGVEIVSLNKNFTHHSATLQQQFLSNIFVSTKAPCKSNNYLKMKLKFWQNNIKAYTLLNLESLKTRSVSAKMFNKIIEIYYKFFVKNIYFFEPLNFETGLKLMT